LKLFRQHDQCTNDMSKSKKSVVNYCKFCDVALEKDEGFQRNGNYFCSEPCCIVWKKTNQSTSQQAIDQLIMINTKIREHPNVDVSPLVKHCYEHEKEFYAERKHQDTLYKAQIYAHLYNKNEPKYLKSYKKFQQYQQEDLDSAMFDKIPFIYDIYDGDDATIKVELTNEESIRVFAVVTKLQFEQFDLMAKNIFKH